MPNYKSNKLINAHLDDGNSIECANDIDVALILFKGKRNKLKINGNPVLKNLRIEFDCNDGYIEIGESNLTGRIRVGEKSTIIIGTGITNTSPIFMTTAEGASIHLGNDLMLASNVVFRGDDSHPIFDIESGARINMPRDIIIEDHVWLGDKVTILSGSKICEGSVIGLGSIVKGNIPNNTIAVGTPARVIKKDIAWERPHLTLDKPYFKPDQNSIAKSKYWNKTIEN